MNSYLINLCVGDSGHDGHTEQEKFLIASNFSKKEIQKYFEIGAKQINCNITEFCYDDGENFLSNEILQKFIVLGLKFKINSSEEEQDISMLDYVNCYLLTVKAGNKNFEFQILQKNIENICIQGYGLFAEEYFPVQNKRN